MFLSILLPSNASLAQILMYQKGVTRTHLKYSIYDLYILNSDLFSAIQNSVSQIRIDAGAPEIPPVIQTYRNMIDSVPIQKTAELIQMKSMLTYWSSENLGPGFYWKLGHANDGYYDLYYKGVTVWTISGTTLDMTLSSDKGILVACSREFYSLPCPKNILRGLFLDLVEDMQDTTMEIGQNTGDIYLWTRDEISEEWLSNLSDTIRTNLSEMIRLRLFPKNTPSHLLSRCLPLQNGQYKCKWDSYISPYENYYELYTYFPTVDSLSVFVEKCELANLLKEMRISIDRNNLMKCVYRSSNYEKVLEADELMKPERSTENKTFKLVMYSGDGIPFKNTYTDTLMCILKI